MRTRTALVTGGNRGLGLAIAKGLLERGMKVVLGVRDLTLGEQAVEDLGAREGYILALAIDLEEPDAIERAVAELASRGLKVDVLVNNAAIYPEGTAPWVHPRVIQEAWMVNVYGPWLLSRAFVPGMMARGYGRVVNVSSGSGSFDEGLDRDHAAYAVTKAALNALTLTLAQSLPPSVKVNAMCPGWVRTRMGGASAPLSPEEGADTAIWLATLPDDGPTGGFFRDRRPIPW